MAGTRLLAIATAAVLFVGAAAADVLETTDDKQMATIGPGEAAVYFVRPAAMGLAINFWAFVDETPAGATKGRTYTWLTVPAGEHLIWSSSGNVSAIKMTLEAGKSYYFEQQVKMGGLRARVELAPLAEEDLAEAFEKTKYAMLTVEGAQTAKERLAEHHAEAVAAGAEGTHTR